MSLESDLGLKTLSQKVADLETKLGLVQQSSSYALISLKASMKEKEDLITKDLENIKDVYLVGIKESKIDISSPEKIKDNILDLVHYSVKFIETHAKAIAQTLMTSLSSGFKLNQCIWLLNEVLGDLFPNSQLVHFINKVVALVYPHKPEPAMIEEPSTKKKSTLKRIGKFIRKQSGCY